jgi:hypothetical protein
MPDEPVDSVPKELQGDVLCLKIFIKYGRRFILEVVSDPNNRITADDMRDANEWLTLSKLRLSLSDPNSLTLS